MKDFILAALPWVVLGITVAIAMVNIKGDKARKEDREKIGNYMSVGMSIGMCFGIAIGLAFDEMLGRNGLTYGICFGMLGGMVIGKGVGRR
ncbi:DUF2700 domain-containing protein [Bacillus sp. AGMB 02131]|uniref:DUF2700 domain-containing protein n=1 Tax=Peribacillus faecalis TaxID=2772559 RepID=A0A927CY78_9BACI|nr:DUF2700 domain-containing protein [Peribacillus faecalis]MBD3109908.1 DUF2700 domain-containing protein [Peribacillus faecalis]